MGAEEESTRKSILSSVATFAGIGALTRGTSGSAVVVLLEQRIALRPRERLVEHYFRRRLIRFGRSRLDGVSDQRA
jgi:hypothetical protein